MEERAIEQRTASKIDILWIIAKAFVGFSFIRVITRGIKPFPGIYGEAFSVVLFTYWIFQNFKKSAQNEGFTLKDCRVPKPSISWRDIVFVLGFLSMHYGIMSLAAERVIYTGQSIWEIISLSMSEILHSGIGSGINEELVVRGYLLKVLEEKIGITKAIIYSSVGFGLIHILNGNMTIWMMVWIAVGAGSLGAMFAVITYETGSIWRAVLAHACVNLSNLIIDYENGNCLFIIDLPDGVTNELVFCMSYAVVSLLCMVVIFAYWIRRRKMDIEKL